MTRSLIWSVAYATTFALRLAHLIGTQSSRIEDGSYVTEPYSPPEAVLAQIDRDARRVAALAAEWSEK